MTRLKSEHKGIEKILGYFNDVETAIDEALENMRDETDSNAS